MSGSAVILASSPIWGLPDIGFGLLLKQDLAPSETGLELLFPRLSYKTQITHYLSMNFIAAIWLAGILNQFPLKTTGSASFTSKK